MREIKLVQPTIHDFEKFTQRAKQAVDSGWLSNNGPFLKEYEAKIEDQLKVPAVAVCNGTAGLMLTLQGLQLSGNVIVPSFTYCATAHAIAACGLIPNFVDIDDTFNLDPNKVEAAINQETSAILAVHVFGNPCQINVLQRIADKHNLKLIFDAAHAFGAVYQGKPIGSFGAAEVFSTHCTKTMSTIEGGLITTKDMLLVNNLRQARNFGIKNSCDSSFPGVNAKLSELHSIVGIDSLEHFPANLEKRRQVVAEYKRNLAGISGITFQKISDSAESSYFFFSIVVGKEFGMNRDDLAEFLQERGIQSRKYFYKPLHQQEAYAQYNRLSLPKTEYVAENILCLPTHYGLTLGDVDYICNVIKESCKGLEVDVLDAPSISTDASNLSGSVATPVASLPTETSALDPAETPPQAGETPPLPLHADVPPALVDHLRNGAPPSNSSSAPPPSARSAIDIIKMSNLIKISDEGPPPKGRVLVTGGAGYVGAVLVKKLLEQGYFVRVLDQLIFGKEPLTKFVDHPNFDLQVGLVEDAYIVKKSVEGMEAVFHLAGLSNDPSCEINPELTRKSNIDATIVLVDAAKGANVKRFIYASSCSVYGFTGDTVCNEESTLNPLTAYAKSKVDSENLILPMASDEFVVCCLRKSTIYGPSSRMRFDLVVNTMTGTAMSEGKITINGGEQWRPFLHVEDAADAYIHVMKAPAEQVNGKCFNVGSNEQNLKIIDLAKVVAAQIPGAQVEQSPSPDQRSYHVAFERINALGWQAKKTIPDGVREVKAMFDSGQVKNFRDLQYFNIKRMVTYLNI